MKKTNLSESAASRFLAAVPGLCVVVFAAYLAVTLLLNVFVDKALTNYYPTNLLDTPNLVLMPLSILVAAGMVLLTRLRFQVRMSDRQFVLFLTLGFGLVYLVQLFLLENMWIRTGWDAGGILATAEEIAAGNGNLVPVWFFSCYPNNFVLVYTEALLLKLAGLVSAEPFRVLFGINALMVCLSVYMAALCVFRSTGSRRVTVLTAVLGIFLIAFSPWITVFYSDTVAMFFTACGIFCYVYVKHRGARYVSVAVCCFVGYLYKPTVFILYIAFLILTLCEFLLKLFRKTLEWREVVWLAASVILALAISTGIQQFVQYVDQTDLDPDAAFPMTHFLLVGHNETYDGVYNDDDVSTTDETLPQDRVKLHIRMIKNRLRAMGVKGYGTFLIRKNINNYNDGTFGWGWEGEFYHTVTPKADGAAPFLKSLYYTEYEGESRYQIFASTQQVLWFVVLLFICICPAYQKDSTQALLSLALLGLSAFVVIFESRARYLLLFTPLFLILCGIGMEKAGRAVKARRK